MRWTGTASALDEKPIKASACGMAIGLGSFLVLAVGHIGGITLECALEHPLHRIGLVIYNVCIVQTMGHMIDVHVYAIHHFTYTPAPHTHGNKDKQKAKIGACLDRMMEHRLMIPFCLRCIV